MIKWPAEWQQFTDVLKYKYNFQWSALDVILNCQTAYLVSQLLLECTISICIPVLTNATYR